MGGGKGHGGDVLRALTVTDLLYAAGMLVNSLAFKIEGRGGREAKGRESIAITVSCSMPRKINLLKETYSLLSWHHGIVIFRDQSAHGGVSDCSGDAKVAMMLRFWGGRQNGLQQINCKSTRSAGVCCTLMTTFCAKDFLEFLIFKEPVPRCFQMPLGLQSLQPESVV